MPAFGFYIVVDSDCLSIVGSGTSIFSETIVQRKKWRRVTSPLFKLESQKVFAKNPQVKILPIGKRFATYIL